MHEPHGATEAYDEPGRYEIRLKGYLDQRWAARFPGLAISHPGNGTTVLVGQVVDQAALYGVLRQIRDLGLPLLSVVHLGSGQADAEAGTLGQTVAVETTR